MASKSLPAASDPAIALLIEDIERGEPPINCSQVRKLAIVVGEGGKQKDVSWVHRQRLVGSRGADGQWYKLPMIVGLGGRYCTSQSAVIRWLRQLNGLPLSGGPTPREQVDQQRHAKERLHAAIAR